MSEPVADGSSALGGLRLPSDRKDAVSIDPARPGAVVIPVVEETVRIERVQRETGRVAVRVRATEEQVRVADQLASTVVEVERVAVGRYVAEMPETREERGEDGSVVTIVPVVEEVVVVEKRLLLREEVRLTRRTTTRPWEETHTVRRQVVDVERSGSGDRASSSVGE